MANLYVTGANGFIGRHMIGLLLERGHHVVGLVRPTSDMRPLMGLSRTHGRSLQTVIGDLRDPGSLAAGLEGAEYVYHLAAVLMGTSEQDFRASIVRGTENLLTAVQQSCGHDLKRFLHTSSLAAAGPSLDGVPLDEDAPPRPVSWYGEAKRDAEQVVRRFGEQGLPVTIVRPVAVYGEGEQELSRGTFPAVDLGLAPRLGFTEKQVSLVYVGDLVEGMVAAAESPSSPGRTYFLSEPESRTSGQLVAAIADAMEKRVRIPMVTPVVVVRAAAVGIEWMHQFTRGRPLITRDKVREVSQRRWICTPAAAERDFGWKAETGLAEGIPRAVADWNERRTEGAGGEGLPARDRAIITYSLAILVGVIVEGLALIGDWYVFDPWWLIFVIVIGVFGGIMGSIAYFGARWPWPWLLLAGLIVGIGAEYLNDVWWHAWEFNPEGFGRLPAPWVRSIVLGLPAGIMPVALVAVVRRLYLKRLRLG